MLQNDLVAWWKLDESNGATAVDSSGNGNSGTVSGGTWNLANGRIGGSLSLSGSGAYVTLPNNLLRGLVGVQSFACWFKSSSSGPLLGYQDTTIGYTPQEWVPIVYIGNDGKLRGQYWNSGGNPITSSGVVNNGAWHHVALVSSGSVQTLYLDGAVVGTLSGGLEHLGMSYNQLGAADTFSWPSGNGGWSYLGGQLDDVRLYSRALSVSEVQALVAS